MHLKERLSAYFLKTRESRLEYSQHDSTGGTSWFTRNVLGRGLRYLLGFVSIPMALVTLYGPDDIATLLMAIFGKDPFTWRKLDPTNRLIYVIASIIPVIPSTVLVDPLMLARETIEDLIYAKSVGQAADMRSLKQALQLLWSLRKTTSRRK